MKVENSLVSQRDIQRFLSSILSFWYLYLILPILLWGVAMLYTHRMTDIYEIQTQVLLKSSEIHDYQSGLFQGLGVESSFNSYDQIESQKRVIKSSNLINECLDRLRMDVAYFIVGRIKTSEVFEHVPFEVASPSFGINSYRTEFFVNILTDSTYAVKFSLNQEEMADTVKFGERILDYGFNFSIEKKPQINDRTLGVLKELNYMFRVVPRSTLVSKFKRDLNVESLDWTSILEITLRDHLPNRAQKFLDTLAAVYIENTLQNKRNINNNTLLFINRQIDDVLQIIEQIEIDLETYKENKAILNIGKEEEEYFLQLVKYESKLRELNMNVSSLSSLEEYIINAKEDVLLPPSVYILSGDKYLESSINEFYNLQIEKNNSLFRNTQTNLNIKEIEERMERLRKNLLIYISNSKSALNVAIGETKGSIDFYKLKVRTIPKNQREILQIKRKLEINERLYTFLLQRKTETVIAKAGIIPETKTIEKPRSMGVVAPNKQRIKLVFISLGIGISLIISFLKIFLFDRIGSSQELMEMTNLTVLGQVFFQKEKNNIKEHLLISSNPKGTLAESFRLIRTNLNFQLGSRGHNETTTLLITSMLPGEGKTFSAVNTAIILALAGKKVLLLDMDLHKPRIHKALNVERGNLGVSSFLIGQSNFEDIIQESDIENLSVATSGPVPPNASELILNSKVNDLLASVKAEFEYTIIDTPPVSLISDANVLMDKVDLGIFVVNQKNASIKAVKFLESSIEKGNKNNVALILNGVSQKAIPYYAKYIYSYGYGYGYGYGGYGYGYGNYNYGSYGAQESKLDQE